MVIHIVMLKIIYISNIVYKFLFVHTHLTTGIVGEKLACTFFEQKGFVILHTNWRYGCCEVDIIASKNNILHFIEVKTRSNKDFGLPEESIHEKKMNNLKQAAEAFLHKYSEWKYIQFDVLSILLLKNATPEFCLLEDVYF